jgi:hypothetical protein
VYFQFELLSGNLSNFLQNILLHKLQQLLWESSGKQIRASITCWL